MDDTKRLDSEFDRGLEGADLTQRQAWHAPVIDIVPIKNAEANGNTNGDGGNTLSC